MKVMVIGSGGREHALVWKLALSGQVTQVYCAPGNAGTALTEKCINVKIDTLDFFHLAKFVAENLIDLTVVGPEVPLAEGIVDFFKERGLMIFGPTKAMARLEADKIYAKELMVELVIPTAKYWTFAMSQVAIDWITARAFSGFQNTKLVVKAYGLAAGKGVIICNSAYETEMAIRQIMIEKIFGDAGGKIIIEEYLEGPEVSVMAICAGSKVLALTPAQDFKKAGKDDTGKNTGGMGSIAPSLNMTEALTQYVVENIIKPIMKKTGYHGLMYVGLMITESGPKVLEFNCRFGDPETQVVLPLSEWESESDKSKKLDFFDILYAAADNTLNDIRPVWSDKKALCVAMCAGGYPDSYGKGYEINGLDEAKKMGALVFHGGTSLDGDKIVTSGGRVLYVVETAPTYVGAFRNVYDIVDGIWWDLEYHRSDIGLQVVKATANDQEIVNNYIR